LKSEIEMENVNQKPSNVTISKISVHEFWIKFGKFMFRIFKIWKIKFTIEIWKA